MLITPTLFHCRMLGIWVGQFVDQCQSLGRNYISPMVTPWHYDCILVLLNLEAKVLWNNILYHLLMYLQLCVNPPCDTLAHQ